MSDERRREGHEAPTYFLAKCAESEQQARPIQKKPAGNRSTEMFFDNPPAAAFAGAFLGCVTTLGFSSVGIVPCIASALTTVLLCGHLLVTRTAGLFAGAFFPALYGGTFGGMTPVAWLGGGLFSGSAMPTGLLFILLSITCGLVFFVVAKLDMRSAAPFGSGYGGRLGAIAAAASFLFVELAARLGADVHRFHKIPLGAFRLEPWTAPLSFLACLGGTLGTLFMLRQQRAAGAATRTFIASALALIGLLILHRGSPGDPRMLEAFYAGCFLGMSTPERLKGWFQPLFGALLLVAVVVLVRAFLPGLGGNLGLAAFLCVALSRRMPW